jgi:prepilin-type N-terminal cleavage/methylation domain-containing protein
MRKRTAGFTIVEIVVTIVIISILVSAAFFGYTQVQKDARDSQRDSRVKLLVEALEKYYAKNGEYPSCSAMTQSATQVVANVLPGLDPNVLTAPGSASGTNSITCTALTAGSGSDVYAYVGDGSTTCSTGTACLYFTLQYRNENTGAIVGVDSKHKTQVAATTGVTITATPINDSQINLSWTAANNATGYQLQRASDANFTTNVVSSSPSLTNASASGLAAGATYYFRVAPTNSTGQGVWSNTTNATTTISSPSTPIVSSSVVGSNVNISTSTVTCGSSTVEYQLLYKKSAGSLPGSYTTLSDWSATTASSTSASQGFAYESQSQARCKGPNATSNPAVSTTSSLVVEFTTPAAPTYLSPSSFKSTIHAIVNFQGYCPSGTTTIDKTLRSRAWSGTNWGPYSWGLDDSWTNNTGSNKNVEYWGKYRCQTTYRTSSYAPESYNVIVVTP